MARIIKILLCFIFVLVPIIFYKIHNNKNKTKNVSGDYAIRAKNSQDLNRKPQIALIFDDLGENLKELKDIYSLDIPLTVSVIPGLKFSQNIAHISYRCGFSVFIHIPLEAKEEDYPTDKYPFIKVSDSKSRVDSLLKYYLNFSQVAIGVNNHMGSLATEDSKLMRWVLAKVKENDLIFVDSRTSLKSVGYDIAKSYGLICGYNQGFIDSVDTLEAIDKKIDKLVEIVSEKGKIIVIAHPRQRTLGVLARRLPELKRKINFVTIKDYFEL
ncbi:MAG: divergent polysaccharide deacetylase family protein [Candidatus Omnitrophica bacterium]|nr:divergent polysaccharide deacetylase family protein [Candidatus Omnitrophota bacterium]